MLQIYVLSWAYLKSIMFSIFIFHTEDHRFLVCTMKINQFFSYIMIIFTILCTNITFLWEFSCSVLNLIILAANEKCVVTYCLCGELSYGLFSIQHKEFCRCTVIFAHNIWLNGTSLFLERKLHQRDWGDAEHGQARCCILTEEVFL